MAKNSKMKRYSNIELYNKLENIKKENEEDKRRNLRLFMSSVLLSFGLAVFVIGITLLIQITFQRGADLSITMGGYLISGGILMTFGALIFREEIKKIKGGKNG